MLFTSEERALLGTAVAQWLRYCAKNQKVAGSIPDGVSGFFIDINTGNLNFLETCGPVQACNGKSNLVRLQSNNDKIVRVHQQCLRKCGVYSSFYS